MQLKRLEAHGFKSFADKIEVVFDRGITAIVGPNGSGKSNITDAVRWVLGEQNLRMLRGAKAEDVIFTGSSSRKALGMAEVSLVFEHQGELPIDYHEVVVTRKLYRSGESEIYLNQTKCRLKDVYELFADTGIGHDGMSIIGQNRIDDILNSKPEDRRAFFEETAGITKYRNRKKEALRKIESADRDLLRVGDILQEIETQLGPLSEQAEKAERASILQAEFQRCDLARLAHDHTKYEADVTAQNEKLEQERLFSVAKMADLAKREADIEEIGVKLLAQEQQMQQQGAENEKLRTQIEEKSSKFATLKEREEQDEKTRARLKEEAEELLRGAEKTALEVRRLTEEQEKEKTALEKAGVDIEGEKEKAKEYAQLIRAQQELCKQAETAREEKRVQLAEKEKELALLAQEMDAAEENRTARAAELAERKQALEALEKERTHLEEERNAAKAEGERAEKEKAEIEENRRGLRERQTKCVEKQAACAKRTHGLESRYQILSKMQDSYEGFGRAVKTVLKSVLPWRKGIAGAVAELIDVEENYVTAVEVALGGSLQNIVAEDAETAKAAIAYLKHEKAGRVTFLPLSTITVHGGRDERILREVGVCGYASDLVTVAPKYKKVAEFLLGRTLVVDTIDHALMIAKKQGYRQRIVTMEGELLSPGGALAGGSRQNRESSFLNRRNELEQLQRELEEVRGNGARIQQALEEIEEQAKRYLAESAARAQAAQKAQIRFAQANGALEKAEEQLISLQQSYAEDVARENAISASFAEKSKRKIEAARLVDSLKNALEEAGKEVAVAADDLDDMEQDAEDLAKYIQQCELERSVLAQKLEGCAGQLRFLEQERDGKKEAAEAKEAERTRIKEERANLAQELLELTEKLDAWRSAHAEGADIQRKLQAARTEAVTRQQELEKEKKEISQALSVLNENIHKLELTKSKLEFSMEECEKKLLEEYGLTPERAKEEAAGIVIEELGARLRQLKAELAALGTVNPNAVEEYKNLKERHDFMEEQGTDLTLAREKLMKLLEEMERAMTKQFKEAFVEIQKHFRAIFIRLFGGGEAELRLTDAENVLTSGVEIIVQLPEKKRQNLAVLSGGERALTVIALLFSFLKYRPSPFVILDEIDAPLDEANVARFGAFLREFAQDTQFIIVTHRKGTMEVVDTMYGVTVEDSGVSKILSVQLKDAEEGMR